MQSEFSWVRSMMQNFGKATAFGVAILLSAPAYAHKVNLFTYVEDDQISIQGYFSDGTDAKNSAVTVTAPDGKVLVKGTTDESGEFVFKIPEKTDLHVVLDAGLGHQAEYTVTKDELAGLELADTTTGTPASDAAPTTAANAEGTMATGTVDRKELQKAVRIAVAEATRPLAKEIADFKEKAKFSDIVGGIGYIFGILGAAAYMGSRKKTNA